MLWFRFFGRTLAIYFVILLLMRIMGKREIGQLSLFDFVVALMIAEIGVLPLEDTEMSLVAGVVPLVTLLLAQLFLSFVSLKSRRVSRWLNGVPAVLISDGSLNERELLRSRYTIHDLFTQLREQNVHDIADVEYAILETSGELSVIPCSDKRPLTPSDLDLKPEQERIPIKIIDDGFLQRENLQECGLTEEELCLRLKEQGISDYRDVLLATYNKKEGLYVVQRRLPRGLWASIRILLGLWGEADQV